MSPRTSETSEGAPAYYPPRAKDASWWRQGARRIDRRLERLVDNVPAVHDEDFAAVLSLIPGLGHLCVERSASKAAFFLAAYCALLLWAWLFSGLGAFWAGMLPLSFHQWIISDCVTRARAQSGLPHRTGRPLMIFSAVIGLMLLAVYRQAGRTVARHVSVVRLTTDRFEPLFGRGDRLVIEKVSDYRRGDIVYSGAAGGVERVIALPGDEVFVDGAGVAVNGQRLYGDKRPLATPMLGEMAGAKLRVPDDSFCVFFPAWNEGLRGERLLRFFMIPRDKLDGRLKLRYFPDVEFY